MGQSLVRINLPALMMELEEVRRRRPDRAFIRHEKSGPLEIPILRRIVAVLQRELWAAGQHAEALEKTLDRAIGKLSARPLTDKSPLNITWQQAARLIYQLEPIPLDDLARVEEEYAGRHDYVKAANYVRDEANIFRGGRDFKNITDQIRKQLATILLAEEVALSNPEEVQALDSRPDAETEVNEDVGRNSKFHVAIRTVNGPVNNGDRQRIMQTFNYGTKDDEA